jgi:Spy/CpxP family protein refolding chaperone
MRKWKLIISVALVFILGVLVGSMGSGLYMKYRFPRHKGTPSEMRAFMLKRFSQQLDLTEKQSDEFKAIIDQMGERLEDHFRKTHSEIGNIIEPGYSQMREVLIPEQQEKFDELIERLKRDKKKRIKHRPPSHPYKPR